MTAFETFATGISPEHLPALIAALLLGAAVWLGLRLLPSLASRENSAAERLWLDWSRASYSRRLTALLLLISGVVHIFIPLVSTAGP